MLLLLPNVGSDYNVILDRACEALPACANADMPFAFLPALLALDAPGIALALHRALMGGGSDVAGPLEEAFVLMDIRLR